MPKPINSGTAYNMNAARPARPAPTTGATVFIAKPEEVLEDALPLAPALALLPPLLL